MAVKHKTFGLTRFKALAGEPEGTFEALVSVYGNVDYDGDRIVPGAWTKSLERWQAAGDPIPVIWSHQWENPDAHIGFIDPAEVEDRTEGLYVKGRLDVDKPTARQVFDLLSERRVKEFSFGYDLLDSRRTKDALELTELDLIETGPCLKGANPATQLLGTKDRATKAQVTVTGSMEDRQRQLRAAVGSWADTQVADLYYAYLEATFEATAIIYAETWDDPYGEGTYWQVPYELTDDGVTWGEAAEVTVTGELAAKTHVPLGKRLAKEGRRNSTSDVERIQGAHDLLIELGALCATETASTDTSTASADPDAKSAAKPDEPHGAKGDEPSTTSLATLRAQLDLEELDAGVA